MGQSIYGALKGRDVCQGIPGRPYGDVSPEAGQGQEKRLLFHSSTTTSICHVLRRNVRRRQASTDLQGRCFVYLLL